MKNHWRRSCEGIKRRGIETQRRREQNEDNMNMSFDFPIFLCASVSLRWKRFRNYLTPSQAWERGRKVC